MRKHRSVPEVRRKQHGRTYTHAESTAEVAQRNPRARVSCVIHDVRDIVSTEEQHGEDRVDRESKDGVDSKIR